MVHDLTLIDVEPHIPDETDSRRLCKGTLRAILGRVHGLGHGHGLDWDDLGVRLGGHLGRGGSGFHGKQV